MGKVSLQSLIQDPKNSDDQEERTIELVVSLKTFGKTSQAYQSVLTMLRQVKISMGDCIKIYETEGEEVRELVDGVS